MIYVIGLIAFILVLSIIVIIHEMGHFLMARRAKILCYEFSVGMGPLIWKKKKGETFYAIRCIPIGGFVSMAGEEIEQDFLQDVKKVKLEFDENNRIKTIICDINDEKYKDLKVYDLCEYDLSGTLEALDDELYLCVKNEDDEEIQYIQYIANRDAILYFDKKQEMQIAPLNRNFVSKTIGQRFLTVFAGPFMNFVLALVIYFVLGVIQGYPNTESTRLTEVYEGSPVYGVLYEGDEILEINGEKVEVWSDISKTLNSFASGNSTNFDGKIIVKYKDKDGNIKTTDAIYPSIAIYSIELNLNVKLSLEKGKVVVGEYSSNNNQTKSYKAGLRSGDIITKISFIDGTNEQVINTYQDILKYFNQDSLDEAQNVKVTYLREDKDQNVTIETYSKQLLESQSITPTKVQLGISPNYEFDIVKLLYKPWVETGSSCISIFKTLGLLFTDSSVNIDDFSGPVGIFSLVKTSIEGKKVGQALLTLLSLMAFLSVNIGFVNLLPLPALDGGRLAFIIFEAVTRKKPSAKVENVIHTIGFLLLMALFVFISFSDVLRCFGCK